MNSTLSAKEIYQNPPFNGIPYSSFIQIYMITTGILGGTGNLLLVFLFIKFKKLQQLQCNWLIIFSCIANSMLGFGSAVRGGFVLAMKDFLILNLPVYMCTMLITPFTLGYRVEQVIALMISLDRFIAVWKPFLYNKSQIFKTISLCAVIILLYSCFITILMPYGKDLNAPTTLDMCVSPVGAMYFKVMPSISGIVTILFFGLYLSGLFAVLRHLRATKKQQAQNQKSLSKIQLKIFTTVAYALCCYSIFYIIPTVLQLSTFYFNLKIEWITFFSTYSVIYGGEINAILNALIYVLKHQEFKECSKQLIFNITGKMKPTTVVNNTTVFQVSNKRAA